VPDPVERKRVEERFRGLLDSAPDPIIAVNRTVQIVFANRETESLSSWSGRSARRRGQMGSIFAVNCAKCHAGHRARRRGGQ